MVAATSPDDVPDAPTSPKVKAPSPKPGYRSHNLLIRSQPIVLDFDAFPAPTSPLPIPSPLPSPTAIPSRVPTRTPPSKSVSPPASFSASLRPPPRPRSIASQLALSNPPSESLPPVPVLLHSNDNLHASSTPTSPTSPSFFTSFPRRSDASLPSNSLRSLSVGRLQSSLKNRTSRKITSTGISPVPVEVQRGRPALAAPGSQQRRDTPSGNTEDLPQQDMAPKPETNEDDRRESIIDTQLQRPTGLVATRFYGIESSMRWRDGVDPIEKRFASSNGSWRCQDRFAIFFRPGDQIGPDQVVTKTFWSEAWPYPIETILYGTRDSLALYEETARDSCGAEEQQQRPNSQNDDQVGPRLRTSLRQISSETHLKSAASFPPMAGCKDPRYISSDGVQKIAKVVIPMPDVSIDQMDLVKAPIKVELRIFILEAPLRIHASASLLGRTVKGATELYV